MTRLQSWVSKMDGWHSRGRTTRSINSRTGLVAGTYVPDAATTGPLITSGWTDQEANTAGVISLATTNLVCEAKTHWGEVRHNAPGIRHNNCRFAGPDLDLIRSGAYGASSGAGSCIKSYGAGYYHWIGENILIDHMLWVTERGRSPFSDTDFCHVNAVDGGDCELRWAHIKHVVDGLSFIQGADDSGGDSGNTGFASTNFTVTAGQRFSIVDRCFLDSSVFVQGTNYLTLPSHQSSGQPHSDGIQFQTGRNCWVTGSAIGGSRNTTGYQAWPNNGTPGEYGNTGHDFANSAILAKQQGGTYTSTDARYLNNILIEDSVLCGGMATVNAATNLGNDLSGVTVRNNRFVQRQSTWGLSCDSSGTVTSQNSGYGYQAAKSGTLGLTWAGNTILETGTALPFSMSFTTG